MEGYKLGFYVSSGLLVASLSYQLLGSDTPTVENETLAPGSATLAPTTTASASASPVASLRQELAKCRDSSWELVAKVVERGGVSGEHVAAAAQTPEGEQTEAMRQREALNLVALTHLRKHWQASRGEIVAAMKHAGSEPWVANDIEKKVTAHQRRFDLNDADVQRLERGYGDLWGEHGERMHTLIADENWDEVMSEVRGFWEDEDRMVGSIVGQEQRDAYRAADTAARTAIVAILATFADQPWDESITW
jgi:hypothetical protein